jgi:hypothetical protein
MYNLRGDLGEINIQYSGLWSTSGEGGGECLTIFKCDTDSWCIVTSFTECTLEESIGNIVIYNRANCSSSFGESCLALESASTTADESDGTSESSRIIGLFLSVHFLL